MPWHRRSAAPAHPALRRVTARRRVQVPNGRSARAWSVAASAWVLPGRVPEQARSSLPDVTNTGAWGLRTELQLRWCRVEMDGPVAVCWDDRRHNTLLLHDIAWRAMRVRTCLDDREGRGRCWQRGVGPSRRLSVAPAPQCKPRQCDAQHPPAGPRVSERVGGFKRSGTADGLCASARPCTGRRARYQRAPPRGHSHPPAAQSPVAAVRGGTCVGVSVVTQIGRPGTAATGSQPARSAPASVAIHRGACPTASMDCSSVARSTTRFARAPARTATLCAGDVNTWSWREDLITRQRWGGNVYAAGRNRVPCAAT